jgi:outer membrane protein OmpA-like peptidoglycan-associated protein
MSMKYVAIPILCILLDVFAAQDVSAQLRVVSTTAPGGRGLLFLQSARTYGQGMLVFGVKGIGMRKEASILTSPGSSYTAEDNPVIAAVPLTLGLTNEIDLNATLFAFHDSRSLVNNRKVALGYGTPRAGLGASYLGVKIRLPLPVKSRFQAAGKFGAFLDTSREELDGMNYFWTRKGTTIESSIYESYDLAPFLSLNLEQGYVISNSNLYDDQVIGGLGLQFFVKNRVALNLEVNNKTFLGVSPQSAFYAERHPWKYGGAGSSVPSFLKDTHADVLRDYLVFSPSVSLRMARNLSIDLGANINLADQVSPKEKYQITAGVTVSGDIRALLDSDHDGIPNNIDRELHTPKGYPVDRNGAALDSDGDGVPDGRDRQLDTPRGSRTNENGVGIDSDEDGVYDGLDMEPATPYGSPVDRFGVALDDDHDGVPNDRDEEPATRYGAVVDFRGVAFDSDGDGVPDGIDVELNTAKGAKVDASGASLDTDGDGVPDGIDEEPNTPEGVLVDKKGRALVKQEIGFLNEGFIRLNSLRFGPASTSLEQDFASVLDEIGKLLLKYPTLVIQIEGHTDDSGNPETNYRLSRERAKSVLDYLLKRFPGLSRERFRVVGFGADKPVASNATPEGRKENRRVDFVVINRSELLRIKINN